MSTEPSDRVPADPDGRYAPDGKVVGIGVAAVTWAALGEDSFGSPSATAPERIATMFGAGGRGLRRDRRSQPCCGSGGTISPVRNGSSRPATRASVR